MGGEVSKKRREMTGNMARWWQGGGKVAAEGEEIETISNALMGRS